MTYQTVTFTPGSCIVDNITGSYTAPGVFTGANGFNNTDKLTITVVPAPATWAMMALGFVALGFAGYRKARNTAALA